MWGALMFFSTASAEQHSAAPSPASHVETWMSHKVYDKPGSQYVVFGDKLYVNRWWTQGDPPPRSPAWREVEASNVLPIWMAEKQYPAGATVIYDTKLWTARRASKGDLPSQSRVWQNIGDPSETAPGDQLARRHKKQNPEEEFKIRAAGTSDIPLFDETASYAGGDVVDFNGTLYRARWWSLGDTPSIDYVWEALGDDPRGHKRE